MTENKKIILILISIIIPLWSLLIYNYSFNNKQVEKLIIENERLRSFNVRRERRLKWMTEPKEINLENVALAFNILGTKPSVTAALLYCENGPEWVETGSVDKSLYFAKNFPINQWSALEGSRTLNRMLWEWLLQDEKRSKSFFSYAAKPYTSLSLDEQKSWANNMIVAEKRFRNEIKDINKSEESLIISMRTPTPVVPGIHKKKNKTILLKK